VRGNSHHAARRTIGASKYTKHPLQEERMLLLIFHQYCDIYRDNTDQRKGADFIPALSRIEASA
jgi:hypothetical protein